MVVERLILEGDVYRRYFNGVLVNKHSPNGCVRFCFCSGGPVGQLVGLEKDGANLLRGKRRCLGFKGVGKVLGKENGEDEGVRVTERREGCDDREEIIRKVLLAGYTKRIDDSMAVRGVKDLIKDELKVLIALVLAKGAGRLWGDGFLRRNSKGGLVSVLGHYGDGEKDTKGDLAKLFGRKPPS